MAQRQYIEGAVKQARRRLRLITSFFRGANLEIFMTGSVMTTAVLSRNRLHGAWKENDQPYLVLFGNAHGFWYALTPAS